jgi:hypothetical protein
MFHSFQNLNYPIHDDGPLRCDFNFFIFFVVVFSLIRRIHSFIHFITIIVMSDLAPLVAAILCDKSNADFMQENAALRREKMMLFVHSCATVVP